MGDPYNHDYSILGSILEYRHLGDSRIPSGKEALTNNLSPRHQT